MRMLSRGLLAALAVCMSSCASGGSNNKSPSAPPPTGEAWSDPATWPSNHVPEAGEDVVIPAGKQVLLDVSPPELGGLTIDGTLVFDDKDIDLTTGWILVHGELRIGTEERLHQNAAKVTLTAPETEDVESMGSRGILVIGGRLELHGKSPKVAWTQLNANADASATSLTLKDKVDWKANDEVVVAPTDFYRIGRTELHSLTSSSGSTIELAEPLEQSRWGQLQYVNDSGVTLEQTDSVTSSVIDERAEVGNLTRNILIQGPDDDLWKNQGFGAHVMVMAGSQARVEGVEFRRVGQAGILARYPMHWHLMSYASDGSERSEVPEQYIRNSTVVESSQRCIVLHATNDVTVQNNICYDVKGHAIFLEDAVERRNVIENNLVLNVHRPDPAQRLLNHDDQPSGFWLTNPDNVVKNNVAADSDGMGFWLAFPEKSMGASTAVPIEPTFVPFGTFDDNTAHSNGIMGVMFDQPPVNEAGDVQDLAYRPLSLGTPKDGSELVPFTISGTRLYKHDATYQTDRVSFWNRAKGPKFEKFVTSDFNGTAFSGASVCEISGALVVGESLNNANKPAIAAGDFPFLPGATPMGAASYHSDCDIHDNVWVNLPAVENRLSGAFSTADYYTSGVDKGLSRNPNNRLINTHPGFRAPSPNTLPVGGGREHFALAGALWDPHGYWGKAGNYWVYDMPFFTDGTTCSDPLEPHKNDRSCAGPYYGVNHILVNGIEESDPAQRNPLLVKRDDNGATWFIDDGNCTQYLGNMRHFAAVRGGRYTLTFPPGETSGDNRDGTPGDQITCDAGLAAGTPTPTKVQFEVTNLLETDDSFVLSVAYSGEATPTVFNTIWNNPMEVPTWETYQAWKSGGDWQSVGRGDSWHPITAAASADAVISSSGDAFYQDKANNLIVLKISRMGMTYVDTPDDPNAELYKHVFYVIRDDL